MRNLKVALGLSIVALVIGVVALIFAVVFPGPTGPQGLIGPAGIRGVQGPTGSQGPPGPTTFGQITVVDARGGLPPRARPGETITVYGAGFNWGEEIRFYLDEQYLGIDIALKGAFWEELIVPHDIERGYLYEFKAEGNKGSKAFYPVDVTKY